MRAVRYIIGFALAALLAAFAIANRQSVEVAWSPFHDPLHIPLYLVVLVLMAFGFVFGAAMVWLNTLPLRLAARRQKKQMNALEKQLSPARDIANLPVLPDNTL